MAGPRSFWQRQNYGRFLVDEIQSTSAEKALHFFIETSRLFGVKIQLEVSNLNTVRLPFPRSFYQENLNLKNNTNPMALNFGGEGALPKVPFKIVNYLPLTGMSSSQANVSSR